MDRTLIRCSREIGLHAWYVRNCCTICAKMSFALVILVAGDDRIESDAGVILHALVPSRYYRVVLYYIEPIKPLHGTEYSEIRIICAIGFLLSEEISLDTFRHDI